MLYKELNFVNQCYIREPESTVPMEWSYRDEIADPWRLFQVVARQTMGEDRQWQNIELEGTRYKYRSFPLHKPIQGLSLRMLGFQVLVQDDGIRMFQTVVRAGGNQEDMLEWLKQHGSTHFAVTTPILESTENEKLYIVPNVPHAQLIQVSLFAPTIYDQLHDRCFTICNGLTLAIAMVRVGVWEKDPFAKVISPYLSRTHPIWPPTIVGNPFFHLFLMSPIPHICDHPYYYARMGKHAAPMRVLRALEETHSPHLVQLMTPFITYISHEDSVGWPNQRHPRYDLHWPEVEDFSEEDDSIEFDLSGYILWDTCVRKVNTQRSPTWATIIDRLIHRHNHSYYEVLDRILLPCFHFYRHGYHGLAVSRRRLQLLWKTVARLVPRHVLQHWTQRLAILVFIYWHNPHTRYYPDIPFPFLQDLVLNLGTDIFQKNRIRLYSLTALSTFGVFLDYMMPRGTEEPVPVREEGVSSYMSYNANTGLYWFTMKISMYQLLRTCATCAPNSAPEGGIRTFYRYIDRRMISRLMGLRRYIQTRTASTPVGSHVVEMLVTEHLQKDNHRMKLIL